MVRGAIPNVYINLHLVLSRYTHTNRLLQLLIPFAVTQGRTTDEKETTKKTDASIGKPVRPQHVVAQNVDILRRLTVEDE